MSDSLDPVPVVIQWPSFGPYHLARLEACERLAPPGMKVIGLATASQIEGRPWSVVQHDSDGSIEVACPGQVYTQISGNAAARAVLGLVRGIRPKVIAISGYSRRDSHALLLWCKRHGVAAILMSDSKADDAPRTALKEWVKRLLVSRFQAAICGGAPHFEYLVQLGMRPERIFDRYDVVDNELFVAAADNVRGQPGDYRHLFGLEDGRPFFLVSSRFIKRKNLDILLQAFAQYRRQCPNGWRLVILGTGPDEAALYEQVRAGQIPDVTFSGFQQLDSLVAYYALAGAFVHPALQEQWGLVINEAMACGLPIVTSRTVGAAYDLVIEGVNGFKFDPESIEALAQLLLKVSTLHPTQLATMGRASRQLIAEWAPEHFARNFWNAVMVCGH